MFTVQTSFFMDDVHLGPGLRTSVVVETTLVGKGGLFMIEKRSCVPDV